MNINSALQSLLNAGLLKNNEVRTSIPKRIKGDGLVAFRSKKNDGLKEAITAFRKSGLSVLSLSERADCLVFVSKNKDRISEVSSHVLDSIPEELYAEEVGRNPVLS